MGGSARKDLVQARRVLADGLYLLEVERETNPTVAAFVEARGRRVTRGTSQRPWTNTPR
jgi:hypothetical protein